MSGPRLLARAAWIIPALLFALALYQVDVARDLTETRRSGQLVWADVTRYDRTDRKDVTNVEIGLTATLPDGTVIDHPSMTLPYSIGHRVEEDSLEVYARSGADQELVIASVSGTHISIAWSNAAMAFIAFLIAATGVFAWNRQLARRSENEPGEESPR